MATPEFPKKAATPQKQLKELLDKEEYTLKKRLPQTLPKRPNDVYVSKKTNFKAQLVRCQKILDNGNEVFVHALGAAINRAINLALQLKANGFGSVEIAVNTSTVTLTDDLEPENDELDYETLTRINSAVHIRIYRPEEVKS